MTKSKIKYIALGPCIHEFPQTPSNLHRSTLLSSKGVDLSALDEDDLRMAVFAVVDLI